VEAVDECGLASPTVPRTARAKSPRGALRLLEADEMLICVFMMAGGVRLKGETIY